MLDEKLRWVKFGMTEARSLKESLMDSSFMLEFLPDIPEFIRSLFGLTVQAPIVNIYSPGDKLAPYRHTSESSLAVLGSI